MNSKSKAAATAGAALLLFALIVAFALVWDSCNPPDPDPIGAIAESRADSARIASDAAREWKGRALAYVDSLQTTRIANEILRIGAAASDRRADQAEETGRARNRTADELLRSLHAGSTVEETATALRGCTDARIGLLAALDACSRARDSLWTYTHGLEAEVVLHEARGVALVAANDLQLTAYIGMEEAYDLRSIQVVGLQRDNRRLTLQRYLYAAGAFAAGYGVAQLTQ